MNASKKAQIFANGLTLKEYKELTRETMGLMLSSIPKFRPGDLKAFLVVAKEWCEVSRELEAKTDE
jgi:hypothetical protein